MFMAEWHRRCRKTTAAINLLVKESIRIPKAKYVYIAPTQVMARNIVWDDPTMIKLIAAVTPATASAIEAAWVA